ncbi:MAG: glutamate formimidoyltransferase [Candidatus Zixiibacteriota bacterium]
MAQLVECVPNFSEGRRPEVIDEIIREITSVENIILLDKEMDPSHNRAVVTFVGPPMEAKEAAFRAYKKAAELIDMREHSGEHPRMGATDVCPFIPISEITVKECVQLAKELAQDVGEKLQIPVFLYEDAAATPGRKDLAKVRQGEYEGLSRAIGSNPGNKPDYGPEKINLKAGATAIGVRMFLVAFNVYLDTNNIKVAKNIAKAIRSRSGGFMYCKALGFEIKEHNCVQVSMNLVNYKKTPIHRVFETIKLEAARYGVNVTSSEIVGLVPNDALIKAVDYYLRFENFSKDQIFEEKLKKSAEMQKSSVDEFFNDVAAATPAPGGGSVASAAGALGAALASMVSRLTVTKKKYKAVHDELSAILTRSEVLRAELADLIIKDKEAFEKVMAAFKLPKDTEGEVKHRANVIEDANKGASLVPLKVAEKSLDVLSLLKVIAEKGNENSITDSGVGALMAKAAMDGAILNVRINLSGLSDKDFVKKLSGEIESYKARGEALADDVARIVEQKLINA